MSEITMSEELLKQLINLNRNIGDLNTKLAEVPALIDAKIKEHHDGCSGAKDSVPPGGATLKISSGMVKKLKIAGAGLLVAVIGSSSAVDIVQKILDAMK